MLNSDQLKHSNKIKWFCTRIFEVEKFSLLSAFHKLWKESSEYKVGNPSVWNR